MKRTVCVAILLLVMLGCGTPTEPAPRPDTTLKVLVFTYGPPNAAIPGATVTAHGRSAITDFAGRIEMTDLPTGNVEIRVTATGFQNKSVQSVINKGTNSFTVTMEPNP